MVIRSLLPMILQPLLPALQCFTWLKIDPNLGKDSLTIMGSSREIYSNKRGKSSFLSWLMREQNKNPKKYDVAFCFVSFSDPKL